MSDGVWFWTFPKSCKQHQQMKMVSVKQWATPKRGLMKYVLVNPTNSKKHTQPDFKTLDKFKTFII